MNTIRNYLDSLFLNVPKTAETQKAKKDLLSIMEDHYYELIEEGKMKPLVQSLTNSALLTSF
ncbi:putative uncharacterized protein [Tetragenococcus halophilus subsp. halophilus]|uniref:Uncharacterized protein n=1 Tax=Tetragenococcus halophilus (strain DSM 20338 / JCM 20259 / NCIMB 9735 / NBRC 12172) TaxID=945021 RepID=A0AAN1SFP4_TETHN|nr:hypothetical protein [Tetragenococcus halophilus]BAK93629.1 hypothetical protein TEH_03020 [Tetragenococcus halophilus NBRC 12172]GBD69882.1 putative uncharacterized protein [Tetragenococcus halophilus subsp. halophilus]GBD80691.1 putative uncharacterized protein [Tetragenococcus halophilus subsp. halophilus]GBD81880.1 putative uncharacterized protein [Tetragenococcus halophilus subsp. halophilus]